MHLDSGAAQCCPVVYDSGIATKKFEIMVLNQISRIGVKQ